MNRYIVLIIDNTGCKAFVSSDITLNNYMIDFEVSSDINKAIEATDNNFIRLVKDYYSNTTGMTVKRLYI